MSEFQFYEYQTIDRPLTEAEQRAGAVHRHTEAAFQARLNDVYQRYPTRHSLLTRLSYVGLPRE